MLRIARSSAPRLGIFRPLRRGFHRRELAAALGSEAIFPAARGHGPRPRGVPSRRHRGQHPRRHELLLDRQPGRPALDRPPGRRQAASRPRPALSPGPGRPRGFLRLSAPLRRSDRRGTGPHAQQRVAHRRLDVLRQIRALPRAAAPPTCGPRAETPAKRMLLPYESRNPPHRHTAAQPAAAGRRVPGIGR